MEKYWLFCENDRLISYDYEKNTFENVLKDILEYYRFVDIERIKETKDEFVFKATYNGIRNKYKIVKFVR